MSISPSSALQPPTLKRIIEVKPNYLTLEGKKIFIPDDYTIIYSPKVWNTYKKNISVGDPLPYDRIQELVNSYVEVNNAVGGRSSRKKKINKSSKRNKALKSSKRARTHRNRRQRN